MPGSLLTFVSAAVRHPGRVGAIAPSSRHLAGRLAAVVPTDRPVTVVELGPGTGAVSAAVAPRLAPGSRHLAVELDPRMATYLREHRPGLEVVEGDARQVATLVRERGITAVDAVVSGLPFAIFDEAIQRAVLTDVADLLGGAGTFTTFAYLHGLPLPAARRFRALLDETFADVEVSRPVWRNVPPALCYACR